MQVEDLAVYQKLCQLHVEISKLTYNWPPEERYELASQARRASNRSPAQLAEKNNDRHVKNRIEGVNRARGEALETVHHLFIAQLKGYISADLYGSFCARYQECVRMLNGLEQSLEQRLPSAERRWPSPPNP
jgi:four helix bundle protein